MAFRSFVTRVGAGSAATAGATGTAHCYSRPSARPAGSQARVDESWILPQVLDNSQILFSEEEVNDTVNLFLGVPVGQIKGNTTITEVDGSDDGSDSSANFHMEAADRSLSSSMELQNSFGTTLTGLLNNAEVQRACVNALRDDPAFGHLLAICPAGAASGSELDMHNLLPPAAQMAEAAGAAADAEDPFKEFLDSLGARAQGIGEKIKNTWDNVGNAVGQAFIRCGLAIHGMLGRPFRQEARYEEQSEWRDVPDSSWFQNPDAVGKVVIKVACVIVALMVFKRAYRPM